MKVLSVERIVMPSKASIHAALRLDYCGTKLTNSRGLPGVGICVKMVSISEYSLPPATITTHSIDYALVIL